MQWRYFWHGQLLARESIARQDRRTAVDGQSRHETLDQTRSAGLERAPLVRAVAPFLVRHRAGLAGLVGRVAASSRAWGHPGGAGLHGLVGPGAWALLALVLMLWQGRPRGGGRCRRRPLQVSVTAVGIASVVIAFLMVRTLVLAVQVLLSPPA